MPPPQTTVRADLQFQYFARSLNVKHGVGDARRDLNRSLFWPLSIDPIGYVHHIAHYGEQMVFETRIITP